MDLTSLINGSRVEQEPALKRWANATTWRGLLSSESHNAFSESWLALLCAQIDLLVLPAAKPQAGQVSVVRQAFVALGDEKKNRYQRVATHGPEMDVSVLLGKAAERAMQLRHGAVQSGEDGSSSQLAYPITIGDALTGVIAVDLEGGAKDHLDAVMRLLQWGAAWFARLLAPAQTGPSGLSDETAMRSEVLSHGLAQGSVAVAAEALATMCAERLGLEKLSLGLHVGQSAKIFAVSHGGFSSVMNDYLAALQAAIAEAADDGAPIAYPEPDGALASPHAAHANLCRIHGCDWTRSVSVDLPGAGRSGDRLVVVAEGKGPVPPELVTSLTAFADQAAPLIALRLQAEEALPDRLRRSALATWDKVQIPRTRNFLLGSAAAAFLLLFVIPFPYRVHTDATLEPGVKRALVAPFDGYMADASARPGDRLNAGAILGRLDDRDLKHQKRDLDERLAETNREITEAMGHFDNAKVEVLTAHKAQIEAESALVSESLGRTVLTAPYDAYVVSGDKTQSTGAPIRRGDTLYEISPLNAFRLELEVPQGDFADVAVGQTGRVLLSSIANHSFPFHIVRITPIASARDGKTSLRVDADLDEVADVLRPGMQGVAEIHVGHAHLFWLMTHHVFDWLRLKLWAWLP